jgi:hypothetical protein
MNIPQVHANECAGEGQCVCCLNRGADASRDAEEIVEVVLRHFHRYRYWSSTAVVLLLEGLRSRKVLVIKEYGGHEDLRGSGRRSVIPYVHGRKELYCSVLVLD